MFYLIEERSGSLSGGGFEEFEQLSAEDKQEMIDFIKDFPVYEEVSVNSNVSVIK